eukprot:scaffold1827_cov421-Prasinococcus_capsulatus_cf.AAC.49
MLWLVMGFFAECARSATSPRTAPRTRTRAPATGARRALRWTCAAPRRRRRRTARRANEGGGAGGGLRWKKKKKAMGATAPILPSVVAPARARHHGACLQLPGRAGGRGEGRGAPPRCCPSSLRPPGVIAERRRAGPFLATSHVWLSAPRSAPPCEGGVTQAPAGGPERAGGRVCTPWRRVVRAARGETDGAGRAGARGGWGRRIGLDLGSCCRLRPRPAPGARAFAGRGDLTVKKSPTAPRSGAVIDSDRPMMRRLAPFP